MRREKIFSELLGEIEITLGTDGATILAQGQEVQIDVRTPPPQEKEPEGNWPEPLGEEANFGFEPTGLPSPNYNLPHTGGHDDPGIKGEPEVPEPNSLEHEAS